MGTPADPIGWAMMAASAVQGLGSIVEGVNESNAMKSRAHAADYEARIAELRGKQQGAARKVELNQALAAIDTLRAGRGVGSDSATGRAIRADAREESDYAINNEVLSHRLAAMSAKNEASALRAGAKSVRLAGFLKAAPKLFQAGGDFASMMGGA